MDAEKYDEPITLNKPTESEIKDTSKGNQLVSKCPKKWENYDFSRKVTLQYSYYGNSVRNMYKQKMVEDDVKIKPNLNKIRESDGIFCNNILQKPYEIKEEVIKTVEKPSACFPTDYNDKLTEVINVTERCTKDLLKAEIDFTEFRNGNNSTANEMNKDDKNVITSYKSAPDISEYVCLEKNRNVSVCSEDLFDDDDAIECVTENMLKAEMKNKQEHFVENSVCSEDLLEGIEVKNEGRNEHETEYIDLTRQIEKLNINVSTCSEDLFGDEEAKPYINNGTEDVESSYLETNKNESINEKANRNSEIKATLKSKLRNSFKLSIKDGLVRNTEQHLVKNEEFTFDDNIPMDELLAAIDEIENDAQNNFPEQFIGLNKTNCNQNQEKLNKGNNTNDLKRENLKDFTKPYTFNKDMKLLKESSVLNKILTSSDKINKNILSDNKDLQVKNIPCESSALNKILASSNKTTENTCDNEDVQIKNFTKIPRESVMKSLPSYTVNNVYKNLNKIRNIFRIIGFSKCINNDWFLFSHRKIKDFPGILLDLNNAVRVDQLDTEDTTPVQIYGCLGLRSKGMKVEILVSACYSFKTLNDFLKAVEFFERMEEFVPFCK